MRILESQEVVKFRIDVRRRNEPSYYMKVTETTMNELLTVIETAIGNYGLSTIVGDQYRTSIEITEENEKGKRVQSRTIGFYGMSTINTFDLIEGAIKNN